MMKKSEDESSSKNLKKYAAFSGLGIQMGASIWLGAYLGGLLDEKYHNEKPVFRLVLILFFFVGSMFLLIRTLKKMEKDN